MGKLKIQRSSHERTLRSKRFTKKRGKTIEVDATTFLIRDRGAMGRGPKLIEIKGDGLGRGFFDKSRQEQIDTAEKRVRSLARQKGISRSKARLTVGRELQAVANVTASDSPRKKEIKREVKTIRKSLQKEFPSASIRSYQPV